MPMPTLGGASMSAVTARSAQARLSEAVNGFHTR
jgi:hypothetical protein